MGIIDRRYVYRGQIRVTRPILALARAGKKRCTIRLGRMDVAGRLIDLTDGRDRLKVRIERIDHNRCFGDLTEDDARCDGFESKEALERELRKSYGQLDPEQPLTFIYFTPVEERA